MDYYEQLEDEFAKWFQPQNADEELGFYQDLDETALIPDMVLLGELPEGYIIPNQIYLLFDAMMDDANHELAEQYAAKIKITYDY